MAATDVMTASLNDEYRTLIAGCGAVDRSERGKLALTGRDAIEFLNGQVTNELADLRPGEGRYAAFLTHKGKMLGDLRVLARGADSAGASRERPAELLLDTERVALQALFDMITRFKVGYDVQLHKRTLQCALLSLVGPRARAVVARAIAAGADGPTNRTGAANGTAVDGAAVDGPGPADVASDQDVGARVLPDSEHAHRSARIAGRSVRLIATAAPLGVDVLCDAADLETVQDALRRAGAEPVSELGAEIVRVEHGRPRYGIDLDDTVIPQEAGLNERAVSFTKGCYVGQETVARLHYKGRPNRHLRGLRLSRPMASGAELRLRERVIGQTSSSVLSPVHGPIALALLRREAEPGMTVKIGGSGADSTVVELPFAT
jgi:tRNA-modifying protein YgfZ